MKIIQIYKNIRLYLKHILFSKKLFVLIICIFIYNDETINNNTVTIRDRDTMEQKTLKLDEVVEYISERIKL